MAAASWIRRRVALARQVPVVAGADTWRLHGAGNCPKVTGSAAAGKRGCAQSMTSPVQQGTTQRVRGRVPHGARIILHH